MRTRAWAAPLLLAFLAATAAVPAEGASSASRFKFKSGKHETGVLYRYLREDIAGTKTGTLLVYVASKTKIEVVRLGPGRTQAEITTAEMAWDTAAVRQFDLYVEKKGEGRVRAASGTVSGDSLDVTVHDPALYGVSGGAKGPASFTVSLAQLPAQLASLDLVTLSLAMRHLVDVDKPFDIGVVSGARKGAEGAGLLAYAGTATVTYLEEVDRDGITCAKFKLTGAPFGAQEGYLWLNKDKDKGYLQAAEVPIASGDWPDLLLTLKGVEKLSETSWDGVKSSEISSFLGK